MRAAQNASNNLKCWPFRLNLNQTRDFNDVLITDVALVGHKRVEHISYDSISSNIYDQRTGFDFEIVNFLFKTGYATYYIRRCIIVFFTALAPNGDYSGLN